MKKIIIILIVLPLFVHSQENKKGESPKKLSFGFSFSPDYANRTLINNDGSSSSDFVIETRDQLEEGKFGFTTGINMNIKLAEKLELQSGFLYANKGYRTPKRATSVPSPRPTEPTHVESRTNLNYLEIPLKINFISGKKKVKFIAGAGLAADIMIGDSDVFILYYADGGKKETDQSTMHDYNKFNLSALISAGVELKIKERISLRTEPIFRYGLLKIVDMPVTAKLWNVGLNIGVYLNLATHH